MTLTLKRQLFTPQSTLGKLFVDGVYECVTLEDTCRQPDVDVWNGAVMKVPHETAIPYGTYEVILSFSDRFQRLLPLLLDVPAFSGVRIHAGNTSEDTEGCVLVGMAQGLDRISHSRIALGNLMVDLQRGMHVGKLWMEVTK